eukprot:m.128608 g.128608  ORF g.128608 m.128608 type:complete len:392 (-) comp13874_c2_seq2:1843-3018(-)
MHALLGWMLLAAATLAIQGQEGAIGLLGDDVLIEPPVNGSIYVGDMDLLATISALVSTNSQLQEENAALNGQVERLSEWLCASGVLKPTRLYEIQVGIALRAVSLSPTGRRLYSTEGFSVLSWDVTSNPPAIIETLGLDQGVLLVQLAATETHLYASALGRLRTFDLTQPPSSFVDVNHSGMLLLHLAASPDNTRLFASAPENLTVWDVTQSPPVLLHEVAVPFTENGTRLALDWDRRLLYTDEGSLITVYDVSSDTQGPALASIIVDAGGDFRLIELILSSDNTRLLSATSDQVLVWNVTSGAAVVIGRVSLSSNTFTSATFGHDASYFYTGMRSGHIVRWNIESDGSIVSTLTIDPPSIGRVTHLKLDPDGVYLYSSVGGTFHVWAICP